MTPLITILHADNHDSLFIHQYFQRSFLRLVQTNLYNKLTLCSEILSSADGTRKNKKGDSCWHLIAARDDCLLGDVFRTAEVNPKELVNSERKTPLHLAASGQMADMLIGMGCGVDARDENGQVS